MQLHIQDNGIGIITGWAKDFSLNDCALELGEFLYQIRAALDEIIYQATIIEGGQDRHTDHNLLAFPICYTASDFKLATRLLGALSDKCREYIESIQPYNTPTFEDPRHLILNVNRTLGILNDWARKDRCRQLHLFGMPPEVIRPRLQLPQGVYLKSFEVYEPDFLEQECVISWFRLSGYKPGMTIQVDSNIGVDIAVNEAPRPAAKNDSLGARLSAMLYVSRLLVDWFENTLREHDRIASRHG